MVCVCAVCVRVGWGGFAQMLTTSLEGKNPMELNNALRIISKVVVARIVYCVCVCIVYMCVCGCMCLCVYACECMCVCLCTYVCVCCVRVLCVFVCCVV